MSVDHFKDVACGEDTFCIACRGKSVAALFWRVLEKDRQDDVEERGEAKVDESKTASKQCDWANSYHVLSDENRGLQNCVQIVIL